MEMHINRVCVDGIWVEFKIVILNNEFAIVGEFTKDGEKYGKDTYCFGHSFEEAMDLHDRDKAIFHARKMLDIINNTHKGLQA